MYNIALNSLFVSLYVVPFKWDLLAVFLITSFYLFVNSWLRHPRIRENWKTVTAAFLLFVAGIGMYEFHFQSLINYILFNACLEVQIKAYAFGECQLISC